MKIAVGMALPAATLKEMGPEGPAPVSADALMAGRRVVVFSVPGAFTPKSTQQQVPSYLDHADEILGLGVDEILCVSVNDAHVMNAWADHCGTHGKIRMLADGHCEFFTALGLEMDCTRFTIGYRCHRFSMIVEDRIVRHLNVEVPGAYDISGAETIVQQLRALNATARH